MALKWEDFGHEWVLYVDEYICGQIEEDNGGWFVTTYHYSLVKEYKREFRSLDSAKKFATWQVLKILDREASRILKLLGEAEAIHGDF